jgi:hypothetical protein
MKLSFVSVNGPRETYFVDAPRMKVDFREIGWDDVDWIDMTLDRDERRALVNTVLSLWCP